MRRELFVDNFAGGGRRMKLVTVPLELKQANEYVNALHRHHRAVYRDKFRVGCAVEDKLVGIVQVGRPVARNMDDGQTLEVVRLCTDGTKNVCSFLYAKAARIAKELGYKRIITYILEDEQGYSLLASGWKFECVTDGGSWNRPNRHREDKAPICRKKRFAKEL